MSFEQYPTSVIPTAEDCATVPRDDGVLVHDDVESESDEPVETHEGYSERVEARHRVVFAWTALEELRTLEEIENRPPDVKGSRSENARKFRSKRELEHIIACWLQISVVDNVGGYGSREDIYKTMGEKSSVVSSEDFDKLDREERLSLLEIEAKEQLNYLWEFHSPLAYWFSYRNVSIFRQWEWYTDIEFIDFQSEAVFEVRQAIINFDPYMGHKFSTFLDKHLRTKLMRYVENSGRFRMPNKRFEEGEMPIVPLGLDDPVGDSGSELADFVPDPYAVQTEKVAISTAFIKEVIDVIQQLPENRRQDAFAFFFQDLDQPEIAEIRGVTPAAISHSLCETKQHLKRIFTRSLNSENPDG